MFVSHEYYIQDTYREVISDRIFVIRKLHVNQKSQMHEGKYGGNCMNVKNVCQCAQHEEHDKTRVINFSDTKI